jgi:hypothetical protein
MPAGQTTRPSGLIVSNLITRPADTTAYASGDLVANSVTAASVTPFTFTGVARQIGYRSVIKQARILLSQVLLANASFRLHLFSALPTVTNGDNGALDVATQLLAYLGFIDIAAVINGTGAGANNGGGGSMGWGYPPAPGEIGWLSTNSANLYGLLEARAAYVPASAQTIRTSLVVDQF